MLLQYLEADESLGVEGTILCRRADSVVCENAEPLRLYMVVTQPTPEIAI
jgi:hypothetical protein